MIFIRPILVSLFFAFSLFNHQMLLAEIREVKIHELAISDCLLPEDHPLQIRLKNLFENCDMFKTLEHFGTSGFHTISRRDHKIMVARHPVIKNYLIKKFSDIIPQRAQLLNYLKRIAGARALQEFIHANNLENIVVPQKWLYALPNHFSDSTTGEQAYLLIVEDMDICTGKGKHNGENAKRYYNIDYDTLRELCIVVYYFRGLDSAPCNMPFTHQNKIAFVDTECWDEWDREGFLPRIMPYLKKNRKKYTLKIFEKLSEQDKRS